MEKIYMEKSQRNNKKRKRLSGSMITALSLVVITVVTVVALGFNNSFAISDTNTNFPDKIVTAEPGVEIHTAGTPGMDFPVFAYFTTDGQQVYCLQRTIGFQDGIEFSKGEEIIDRGLLYILANAYPNTQLDSFLNENLQTWITQVAVWMYLYEIAPEDPANFLSKENIDTIMAARGVFFDDDFEHIYTANPNTGGKTDISKGEQLTEQDPSLYENYIKPLVDEALKNNVTPPKEITIDLNDEVSISDDEKFYMSSLISVAGNPSDNFRGYELVINAAPEGTSVMDANGKLVEDLSNFSPTDKFYFVVPVDKVTEENKTIKFSVNGAFKVYTGYSYHGTFTNESGQTESAQTIAFVGVGDKRFSDGKEIPLNYTPEVPDTGMSTAQTVYFIGLIILLSGVGIIYANVKPKEN